MAWFFVLSPIINMSPGCICLSLAHLQATPHWCLVVREPREVPAVSSLPLIRSPFCTCLRGDLSREMLSQSSAPSPKSWCGCLNLVALECCLPLPPSAHVRVRHEQPVLWVGWGDCRILAISQSLAECSTRVLSPRDSAFSCGRGLRKSMS